MTPLDRSTTMKREYQQKDCICMQLLQLPRNEDITYGHFVKVS